MLTFLLEGSEITEKCIDIHQEHDQNVNNSHTVMPKSLDAKGNFGQFSVTGAAQQWLNLTGKV